MILSEAANVDIRAAGAQTTKNAWLGAAAGRVNRGLKIERSIYVFE
jgi:hypothetical protein